MPSIEHCMSGRQRMPDFSRLVDEVTEEIRAVSVYDPGVCHVTDMHNGVWNQAAPIRLFRFDTLSSEQWQ